jgi:hypothetical protein
MPTPTGSIAELNLVTEQPWTIADVNDAFLYILPNTKKGIVTWMEPVTDAQYATTSN